MNLLSAYKQAIKDLSELNAKFDTLEEKQRVIAQLVDNVVKATIPKKRGRPPKPKPDTPAIKRKPGRPRKT